MANLSARDFFDVLKLGGRVVEVFDGLSEDADQNRELARNKLIAPYEKSRRRAASPIIETLPSEEYPPPPSRVSQRPTVESKAPAKESRSCDIPIKVTTAERVKPPLPPRTLRQLDIRSKSVDGTKPSPDPSSKSLSPNQFGPRCNSCAPSDRPSLEVHQKNSLRAAANLRPSPQTSTSTTPRSSFDSLSPRQSQSSSGTASSSIIDSPTMTSMKTKFDHRASFEEIKFGAKSALEEEVRDDGPSDSPETLSFADKLKHLEGLLSGC